MRAVYRLVEEGKIPYRRLAGRLVFDRAELDALVHGAGGVCRDPAVLRSRKRFERRCASDGWVWVYLEHSAARDVTERVRVEDVRVVEVDGVPTEEAVAAA